MSEKSYGGCNILLQNELFLTTWGRKIYIMHRETETTIHLTAHYNDCSLKKAQSWKKIWACAVYLLIYNHHFPAYILYEIKLLLLCIFSVYQCQGNESKSIWPVNKFRVSRKIQSIMKSGIWGMNVLPDLQGVLTKPHYLQNTTRQTPITLAITVTIQNTHIAASFINHIDIKHNHIKINARQSVPQST